MDAQHVDGLSTLLQVDNRTYGALLYTLGWIKKHKGSRRVSYPVQIDLVKSCFDALFPEFSYELTKAKVAGHSKPIIWLRMGEFDSDKYTPAEQMDGRHVSMARLDGRLLSVFHGACRYLSSTEEEPNPSDPPRVPREVSEAAQQAATDAREAVRSRLSMELNRMVASLSNDNISAFAQKDLYGRVKAIVDKKERERARGISTVLGTVVLPEIGVDEGSYPSLAKFGVPLDPRTLSSLLADVVQLEEKSGAQILLNVKAWNNHREECLLQQMYLVSVTGIPMLDAVPLARWGIPILHCELGLVNYIINIAEAWVHTLFDPAPSEELELARRLRLRRQKERKACEEAIDNFQSDASGGLALMGLETDLAAPNLSAEATRELKELIKVLKSEEQQLRSERDDAKALLRFAKTSETKLAKGFGRLARPTCLAIENVVYKAMKITRPPYHGGDFVGTTCRLILKEAADLFDRISALLLALDEQASGVTDEEIGQFTAVMTRLLQHGDAIFATARKGERQLTAEERVDCASHIKRFCRLWRLIRLPVTVKLHLIEDHLMDYLGNGERLEDAMEQHHQVSNTFEVQTRMSDYGKKSIVASNIEARRKDPAMLAARETMIDATKREKRREKGAIQQREAKKQRVDNRYELLALEELTVFPARDNVLFRALAAAVEEE
jgi:hypothetical protein